jgi:hypothetical protein
MHLSNNRRKKVVLITFILFFLPGFIELCTGNDIVIRGRVTDSHTYEPLAFVHVVVENSRQGTMTDIDGYFSLQADTGVKYLQLSYVGYYSLLFEINDPLEVQYIKMQRRLYELSEVVVFPGENPAHRIIRNVIENRNANNPERLSSFTYNSYNKFLATLDRDYYLEQWELSGDTANHRLADFLDKRHIFIMESVTERKFRYPNLSNERILANRVSGLENPLFSLLATELQSFSFYGNQITILETNYISPLNPAAFSRYVYHLKDTLYQGQDTVFVVGYHPVAGANYDGLEGLLYINTNKWALQNVIAKPSRQIQAGLNFRIQQMYEQPDGEHWFPVQLNSDIDFSGQTDDSSSNFPPLRMLSRNYIRNISVNPPLSRREFSSFDVDFDSNANLAEPSYWDEFRQEPLTSMESNTYLFMDSLGMAHNLDALLNLAEPLIFGDIPLGIVNLPLNRFYRYNDYERHRIGLGMETNRKFSQRLKLGGYYAWSTGDKEHKYKYFGEILIDKSRDFLLGYAHSFDVSERGSSLIMEDHHLLSPTFIRNLYRGTMDVTDLRTAYISFRVWRNFIRAEIGGNKGKTHWNDKYLFIPQATEPGIKTFRFSEITLRTRFAYGETLMNTPMRVITLPSIWPVFYFNVTRGFSDVFNSSFDYWKLEARLDVNYRIPFMGSQHWIVESGWLNRNDLPWPLMFTARAGGRGEIIASPFSFGAMQMSEFKANRHISIFFQHNFGSLLFRRPGYNPELVIISNFGWGSMSGAGYHQNTSSKSWNKGYYESGIAINKILPQRWVRKVVLGISPGIELLYRYGPYAFENRIDNFTLKLSLVTAF